MNVILFWRPGKEFRKPSAKRFEQLAVRAAEIAGTNLAEHQTLSVTFLNLKEMEQANWDLVHHSGDTDVICFDYRETDAPAGDMLLTDPDAPDIDIISCPAVALREAGKRGLPYARELTLYLVHALLHAAGYDDLEPRKKRAMRRAEKRVMTALDAEFDFEKIFKLKDTVEN